MTEQYSYDTYGNVLTTIDPNGNTTTYCYDIATNGSAIGTAGKTGNLTRIIDPKPTPSDGQIVSLFSYDSLNNPTSANSPRGVSTSSSDTITCAFNLTNRVNSDFVSTMTYGGTSYDSRSHFLLSATSSFRDPDAPGTLVASMTTYTYTDSVNKGKVTTVTSPRSFTTTSSYTSGLPTTVIDPYGGQAKTTYDSIGRALTSQRLDNGSTVLAAGRTAYDTRGLPVM